MVGYRDQRKRSPPGAIDVRPSGARRVRVHAGTDPVTKRKHRLVEVVPAGPDVEARAEAVRARLVQEVAERRNPRTAATIDHLLDRYLEQFDGAASCWPPLSVQTTASVTMSMSMSMSMSGT